MALQTNVLSQLEKKAQFEAELQRYEEQADFLFRKQRLERIEYFSDQYEFLANEYPCPIFYEGLLYHSVYTAFQAARALDEETRQRIASTNSVLEVFHIAQHIEDPKDWSRNRLRVMETLLRDKFRRNSDLRDKLRDTNNYQLINTQLSASASNLFWGVYDSKGQNQLGRILEEIRSDLQNNEEIDKWLFMSFKIEKDKNLIPQITLSVEKENMQIETIILKEKPYFYFGQQKKNDLFLAHPSVSRRHCVLFINELFQVQIIDLGSKAGTLINEQQIEAHFPYTLINQDKLKFAKSSRIYIIEMDHRESRKYLLNKIRDTKHRVNLLDKVQSGKANQEELRASLGMIVEDIVMVQDLPERISHFELQQLFSQNGRKINELKIPLDKSTGNTRNVAFIKYENDKHAQQIVNDRIIYKGKTLKLSLASSEGVEKFLEELRWGQEKIKVEELQQSITELPQVKQEEKQSKESKKKSHSRSRSRSRSQNKNTNNNNNKDRRHKTIKNHKKKDKDDKKKHRKQKNEKKRKH